MQSYRNLHATSEAVCHRDLIPGDAGVSTSGFSSPVLLSGVLRTLGHRKFPDGHWRSLVLQF